MMEDEVGENGKGISESNDFGSRVGKGMVVDEVMCVGDLQREDWGLVVEEQGCKCQQEGKKQMRVEEEKTVFWRNGRA